MSKASDDGQEAFARRAEARRKASWLHGVASSHADMDDVDFAYWQGVDPSDRFMACFEATHTAWSIRKDYQSRISFSSFGVRRWSDD